MNIDVADVRDLTVYKRDFWRGSPALALLGIALLPAFGAGAVLLWLNVWKQRRQHLILSHRQLWYQGPALFAPTICCDRKDVTGVEIKQSWLQSLFGGSDLVIHSKTAKPIRVRGLVETRSLQWRLTRHLADAGLPDYIRKPIPVGKAPLAPRLLQTRAA